MAAFAGMTGGLDSGLRRNDGGEGVEGVVLVAGGCLHAGYLGEGEEGDCLHQDLRDAGMIRMGGGPHPLAPSPSQSDREGVWIPAFAGMTGE